MRVAVDVTPLAGPRTGIGHFVAALTAGLGGRPDVELVGLAVTARGRDTIARQLPADARLSRPVPARLIRRWWTMVDRPTISTLTGPVSVVHGTNYVVPPGGRAAELVSIHDLSAWRSPDQVHETSRVYPDLVRRALARGAHVHAISEFVADEMPDVLGVDRSRVHMVPLAADPLPSGDGRRARARVGSDYVLAVGTVEPRKDYPRLVEAMAQLPSSMDELRLVIAGTEGWGTDELDRVVERTGMGSRVVRLGYVSTAEKADLLAGATAVASTSTYEGFGIVPLEAMAAGVPVVATDGGSVPEICGPAAELVPVGDVDRLTAGLERVITDDQLRAERIELGRARSRLFTWDRTVEGLVETYRRLSDR